MKSIDIEGYILFNRVNYIFLLAADEISQDCLDFHVFNIGVKVAQKLLFLNFPS